jgi:hypothetical protein
MEKNNAKNINDTTNKDNNTARLRNKSSNNTHPMAKRIIEYKKFAKKLDFIFSFLNIQ